MKRFPPFTFHLSLICFVLALYNPVFAQDDQPVSVKTEIFVVNQITGADGAATEDLKPAQTARPGQIVEYRLVATNDSDTTLPAGTIIITGPVPDGTTFVPDSATPKSERILTEYSADGTNFSDAEAPVLAGTGDNRTVVDPKDYKAVRWTLLVPLEPSKEEAFAYRVTVNPANTDANNGQNCQDFVDQKTAQAYYEANGRPTSFDSDNDGLACEELP